jgi:teichuronic acid biosynthesis glycosyltransferase TuaC
MRVLWTHNFNPEVANAGRFMHILADGVRRQGVELELMYLGALGSIGSIRRAMMAVAQKSQNFDITHAQFGSACGLVSTTAQSVRVVSLRGSDWHRYRGGNWAEYRHGILAVLFTRLSLKAYQGVVVMSKRMASEVRPALGDQTTLQTLADPVDTSIFFPRDRHQARQELGVAEDASPWILFTTLSPSNPVKRADLAMQAVALAAQRVPGLQLKVATGLDHTRMPTFVSACNLALCTSTHEGWPNSIKEALASGLPFVSTDVSDLTQIAKQHAGCYVCPPDAEALSDAIVRSLSLPASPGLREVGQSMNVEVTSTKLVAFYTELLRKSREPA